MKERREFLKQSLRGSGAILGASALSFCTPEQKKEDTASVLRSIPGQVPLVISTWNRQAANEAAWKVLGEGGYALDAVEAGVRVPEADPDDRSVGYGGRPDRDGKVTLDSCIMNELSQCGAVAFLEHIKHPVSVARKVMEDTPHVMLVGEGALNFALQQGFKKENLLIPESEEEWKKWLETSHYEPLINIENHDTIGMLAIDKAGRVSGACTTSGAAYKMQGRVGDSPIIGAGLFVDGDVGAATATGLGEAVIRVCGTHLVVEYMRNGMSPMEACKAATDRVIQKEPDYKNLQVGFVAINIHGEYGGYSIHPDFSYTVTQSSGTEIIESKYAFKG